MLSEFRKVDAHVMSMANKKKILALVREHQQLARADLSKMTGLAIPTVARLLEDLITNDKLVKRSGIGSSSGGRKPNMVEFNYSSSFIIGIDIGATYTRGMLADLNGNAVFEIQVKTEIEKGFFFIIENVVSLIKKILSRRKLAAGAVHGIGLGIAGLVNHSTGEVEFSPDFKWQNVNLQEELEARLSIPFYFDNSSRLMALGELEFGQTPHTKNFAVLNLGFGIACGLVVEGNLVNGSHGFAGELGHITVDYNSKIQCKCGQFGCLEALASGHRIAALGKQILFKNGSKKLNILFEQNGRTMDARLIALAASEGDAACIKVFDEVTNYLCIGLRTIVNLLNPDTIYLGGGISLSGGFFFQMIEKKLQESVFNTRNKVVIRPCSFQEHATLIGAISLVLTRVMNFDNRNTKPGQLNYPAPTDDPAAPLVDQASVIKSKTTD